MTAGMTQNELMAHLGELNGMEDFGETLENYSNVNTSPVFFTVK